jgi:hypothetical protein
VDGNDVRAVYAAVSEAVAHARAGGGPSLIEARTFRMSGHSEADPAAYVPTGLLVEWAERDPIARFEAALLAEGMLDEAERSAILARIEAEVEEAVRFAEASPPPDPATLAVHVYSDDGTGTIKPRRLPETPAAAPLGAAPSAEASADIPAEVPDMADAGPEALAGPASEETPTDAPEAADEGARGAPAAAEAPALVAIQRAGITHDFGDVAGDVVDADHSGELSTLNDAPVEEANDASDASEPGDTPADAPSDTPVEAATETSKEALEQPVMATVPAEGGAGESAAIEEAVGG